MLALELARFGINVNCVCPGLIGTSRIEEFRRAGGREAVAHMVPLGRMGDAAEVGELVAFLCGPDASYVHGQAINIDGGRVMS